MEGLQKKDVPPAAGDPLRKAKKELMRPRGHMRQPYRVGFRSRIRGSCAISTTRFVIASKMTPKSN